MLEQSLDANKLMRSESMSAEMRKKSLKVDRKGHDRTLTNLLQAKPLKRSKVKVSKRKPEKLFPPQE